MNIDDHELVSDLERKRIRGERISILLRNPAFLIGSALLGFWVLCAILGDSVLPHKAEFLDMMNSDLGPSKTFWFGTDSLGRDVFSRVIVGARPILLMATGATVLGTVLGSAIGLTAGYFKGRIDLVVMRVLDAVSAMPVIILALLALSAMNGSSEIITVVIIGFVFTPIVARTVRAAVLGEAELEYVAAARLRTERTPHILVFEILPNVLSPIIVEFTVRLGYAIFALATLSFLGAGVEPGSPNWGSQVAENYSLIFGEIWWSTVFPAGAIATLAIGVNLIADGLVEAFEI